ncbi:MAG: hypothetical protein LBG45_08940 [Dysgonamonadaceae bacterium]|nr:hypothetical protein [Dysgonamonadaceae bacterium]
MDGNGCRNTRPSSATSANLTFPLPMLFWGLYRRFFKQLKFDSFTLDTDSPVMTRYGYYAA